MKYVAAYTLLALSGKKEVDVKDLENFFKQIDSEFDNDTAKVVINSLKGKNLNELVKNGLSKVGNIGGGSSSNTGGNQNKTEEKEEKVEEEKVEEEEEDFNLGLFDDDD